nr:MAG TPA: hypothetical protein [Caudoviricetes sp.]
MPWRIFSYFRYNVIVSEMRERRFPPSNEELGFQRV